MTKLIFILFLILLNINLYSQDEDSDAIVQIRNTVPLSPQVVEFEVHLMRHTDLWERFANATFQLQFYTDPLGPAINVDFSEVEFTRLPGSDLNIIQGVQPKVSDIGNQYYVENTIKDGRFLITVLGPEKFDDAQVVPETLETLPFDQQETILLGKFRIEHTDIRDRIPPAVRWVRPLNYFQATAFKIDTGRTVYGVSDYFYTDDNVELDEPVINIKSSYKNDPTEPPGFQMAYFDAKYKGEQKIELSWKTEAEIFLNGFVIKRVILDYFATDEELASIEKYDDAPIVFHYDPSNPNYNEELVADRLYKNYPTEYGPIFDELTDKELRENRGKWYCYMLYRVDWKSSGNLEPEFPLAQSFVQIPNSVISFAQASPNPFSYSTRVDYELNDDVDLHVAVYDVQGKMVKEIVPPDTRTTKGVYTVDLNMPENATQGIYNLIFNASPVRDDQVRSSTALVKLQMIK